MPTAGWTVYRQNGNAWERVTKARWAFETACNVARAFSLTRGGVYCVNFVH